MRGVRKYRLRRWEHGRWQKQRDQLVVEEPLEIQLRAGQGHEGQTVAITMRTPGADYELAAGFLYGEGIISHQQEISTMSFGVADTSQQDFNLLTVRLRRASLPALPQLAQLDRHFFTNSACGVCGTKSLADLAERDLPVLGAGPHVTPELLLSLPEKLAQAQTLFGQTGGLHAAALFTAEGELLQVREDVGRHNALDKLVGWGVLNGQLPFTEKILLVSGRASYELLQKAIVAGVPVFTAVSAPSSLAVSLAVQYGVTLVGFLRAGRFNLYHDLGHGRGRLREM